MPANYNEFGAPTLSLEAPGPGDASTKIMANSTPTREKSFVPVPSIRMRDSIGR